MSPIALYDRLVAGISHLEWLPQLVTRITIGWVFIESGWGKLHNLDRVIGYFQSLGIPAPAIQAPSAPAKPMNMS